MPVDGAWLALDPVREGDLDAVALLRLDQRSWADPVISKNRRVPVGGKARRGRLCCQPRLEQAGPGRFIRQQRQFAQGLVLGQRHGALTHRAHVMAGMVHTGHVRHVVHLHLGQRARARQNRHQACRQKTASMHFSLLDLD
ncbi:hypothetical protein [Mesorhizobium sp. CA7]|uniref:hypothetical protein n=1 Tax=Mesorhizobium sp. CA7 TaxID=588501 RepID=UPI00398D39DA